MSARPGHGAAGLERDLERNTVWLSPGATSFSCLCEACLDTAGDAKLSFLDAVRVAVVRGTVAPESDVAFARCPAGHEVVLRRIERPPALSHPDERQLQLA